MHQDVQPLEALEDTGAELVHVIRLTQIEWQQRRRTARRADRIVRFFQAALASCGNHRMRAQTGQFDRHGRTQPPAGAGHQRHRPIQIRHQWVSSRLS